MKPGGLELPVGMDAGQRGIAQDGGAQDALVSEPAAHAVDGAIQLGLTVCGLRIGEQIQLNRVGDRGQTAQLYAERAERQLPVVALIKQRD